MDIYRYDEPFRVLGRLAGIDEAGRGPIAGPVVAGVVVLPPGTRFSGLRDSKLVPEKERERLFYEILSRAEDIGVGICGPEVIDRLDILRAAKLAMKLAVENLSSPPDMLLVDAVQLPDIKIRQESPIKGDSKSASIAAASVVAKFVRDSLMGYYHLTYPEYGFDRHKGYCTEEHMLMLNRFGPCPIHRKSWGKVMSLSLPF